MTMTPRRPNDSYPEIATTEISLHKMSDKNHSTQGFNPGPTPESLVGKGFQGFSIDDENKNAPFYCHIESLLGQGGMGYVYTARNGAQIGALKIMSFGTATDRKQVERFDKETRAIKKIDHINVIKILFRGVAAEDGRAFFVMPVLKGQTLSELLRTRNDLPLLEKLDILIDICSGLAAAHEAGIVHRDLKPSNIMVLPWTTADEEIRGLAPPYPSIDEKRLPEKMHKIVLVDFGIAKILPRGDVDTQISTTTGDIFGTPLYMSPEQCLGEQAKINEKSDIYAMGCLMYEVLAGKPAFLGKQHIDTMNWHMGTERPPLESVPGARSSTIQQLNPIVGKAFKRHPEERWQSIAQLRTELLNVKASLVKDYLQEPQAKAFGKSLTAAQDAKSDLAIFGRRIGKKVFEFAKKNVVAISAVMVIGTLAYSIGPDLMTNDPGLKMSDIAWERVSPPPLRSADQFKSREKQLSFAYATELSSGPASPELFTTVKDMAELYYENDNYQKAASLYGSALKIGKELEQKGIETQAQDMAAISLPAAFSFYRLGDYDSAFSTCELGLNYAKLGNARAGKPVFFRGILAGSYGILIEDKRKGEKAIEVGKRLAHANATVFMALLKQDGPKTEESYDIGLLTSDVGDYYARNHEPELAAACYHYALSAWAAVDERGKYNEAVANARLGLLAKQKGDLKGATELLDKAVSMLAATGTKYDSVRARTMFCLADTYSQMQDLQDYSKGFFMRNAAAKLWREKRKGN